MGGGSQPAEGWRLGLVGVVIVALVVIVAIMALPRRYGPIVTSDNLSAGDEMSYGVLEAPDAARRGDASSVREYLIYVADERVSDRPGDRAVPERPFSAYVAGGLRRLASAIEAVAARDTVLEGVMRERLTTLSRQASAVESEATAHAARQAFLSAAVLLDRMYALRFHVEAANPVEVWAAAQSLSSGEPLERQRGAVRSFFEHAGRVLGVMSARS